MRQEQEVDWQWFRCSILGCGAVPLRVRRHLYLWESWSVGFIDSAPVVRSGPAPTCPHCGQELEPLAQGGIGNGALIGQQVGEPA
ncbi:MAG: hypothetical protein ACREMO_04595 [Gemmatimonadales bacterium]